MKVLEKAVGELKVYSRTQYLIPSEWIQHNIDFCRDDVWIEGTRSPFIFASDEAKESKCSEQQRWAEEITERRQIGNRTSVRVDLEPPHRMDYHMSNQEK